MRLEVVLRKIAGRDHERISRLHTRRGQLVLRGAASAALARRRTLAVPWMAPAAITRLDRLLTRNHRLLELGSGSSTLWYAQHCGHVVSVEDDAAWATAAENALAGLTNARLVRTSPRDYLATAEAFDVVIVDQNEDETFTRVDAVKWAAYKRTPIVVLDDSDRCQYAEADEVLRDWKRERYVGFRPRPLVPTETTIYILPATPPTSLRAASP